MFKAENRTTGREAGGRSLLDQFVLEVDGGEPGGHVAEHVGSVRDASFASQSSNYWKEG